MGYLGDLLGRNAAMTITLAITTFGAMLSSIAPAGDASTVYLVIIVFRFERSAFERKFFVIFHIKEVGRFQVIISVGVIGVD